MELLVPILLIVAGCFGMWLTSTDQDLIEHYRSIAEQNVHATDAALVESKNTDHFNTLLHSTSAECVFIATNKDTGKTYKVVVDGYKVVSQEELSPSEVQVLKIKSEENKLW